MSMKDKPSGFTLIEIMILITISATLAGIALTNYIEWLPKSRLNGAAMQIMGDLMWARMQAVTQNNEFKIFFLNNNHTYKILDDDNNNGNADIGEWTATKNIQTEYSDVILSTSINPIFHSRGTANPFGIIKLTNCAGSKKVKIHITGRVMIEKVDVNINS